MNIQTVNHNKLFFINVSKPTDFEMRFLKNTYDFSALNLEDFLYGTQIPKIESYDKYDLFVLRFPVITTNEPENAHQYGIKLPSIRVQTTKRKLESSYINFFISKEYLVVVHDGLLPQIDDIFSLCQKSLHNRAEYMEKGSVFLAYKIIDALTDACFPVVNEITATIDKVDKELEERQSQKTLEEISEIRRNLVVFHTMIKPILPIFKELKEGKHERLDEKMKSYWRNILDHLQKIMDRVEDNRELIEGISESNESLLTSRTNEIVKFLTVITSLAFPFVLINNLYSMNVTLPAAHNPDIVWYLFGIIFVAAFVIVVYFRRKKWL